MIHIQTSFYDLSLQCQNFFVLRIGLSSLVEFLSHCHFGDRHKFVESRFFLFLFRRNFSPIIANSKNSKMKSSNFFSSKTFFRRKRDNFFLRHKVDPVAYVKVTRMETPPMKMAQIELPFHFFNPRPQAVFVTP